jgi:hypothetical protein
MKILIALALLLLLVGLTATKSDNDLQGRAVGHILAPDQTGNNPGLDKDDGLSSEDADGQPPGLTEDGNYGQSNAPGQDGGVGYYYCYPAEYGLCTLETKCCSGTGNCVNEAGSLVQKMPEATDTFHANGAIHHKKTVQPITWVFTAK